MKKAFCKVISVLMLIVMIFSTGVAGVNSFAASEADYVATFSIKTDKKSLSKGENVVVSVNLKTNYYIYAMEIPVIYDGDALEVQNTSSNPKSFLTFKGKLASAYVTNGNWKSPSDFYTNRNSNTAYWSQESVMNRYKIAFASWSADTQLNDGKAVKLSTEETIVSFVLKAKKDISNVSGLIFLSNDFKKTESFAAGRWFCGRSKTEYIDANNYVARGQTLKYVSATASSDLVTVSFKDSTGKVVKTESVSASASEYSFSGLSNGKYTVTVSKDGYVSKVTSVTVSNGSASIGLKLCKPGDVNGDGKVNTVDVARANVHAKGVKELSGYEFTCADVTKDSKVNTIDVARINIHAKGVSTLW